MLCDVMDSKKDEEASIVPPKAQDSTGDDEVAARPGRRQIGLDDSDDESSPTAAVSMPEEVREKANGDATAGAIQNEAIAVIPSQASADRAAGVEEHNPMPIASEPRDNSGLEPAPSSHSGSRR